MRNTLHIVCVLLAYVTLALTGRPCIYQECTCNTLKIDCKGRSLTSIPKLVSGNFPEQVLDISNTSITTIPSGALPANLNSFYARHTPLSLIDDNAFANSEGSMRYMIIQDTKLAAVPNAFTRLKNLEQLAWYGQARWPASVRAALGRSVTKLTLEQSGLSSLPDWLNTDFSRLQSLSFKNNQMSILRFESLQSGLNSLNYLHLDNNGIQHIEAFTFPSSLKMLYLLHNNIQQVSKLQFSRSTSDMTYLNLRHNPLKLIANDAFDKLTKLTTLYLDSTQLTRLPLALGSLTALKQMDLTDIPGLVCSCEQKALAPWFKGRSSDLRVAYGSKCQGSDVTYFLSHLAQQCP